MPTQTSFASRLPSHFVIPPKPLDPREAEIAQRWEQIGVDWAEGKRLRKALVADTWLPDWIQVLFYHDELATGISFFLFALGLIGMVNMGLIGILAAVLLAVFERLFFYQFQPYGYGVSGMYSLWSGFILAGGLFGGASKLSSIAGSIITIFNLYSAMAGHKNVAHWQGHIGNSIIGFLFGVGLFYILRYRAANW